MRLEGDETQAPSLTWRVWLLAPLVFVSLVGVVVPLNESHKAPPPPKEYVGKASEPRVPYDDELDRLLLSRPEIRGEELRVIQNLHLRCRDKRNAAGKIPRSLRARGDRVLEKYFHLRAQENGKALPADIGAALDAADEHEGNADRRRDHPIPPVVRKPKRFHLLAERPYAVCVEMGGDIDVEQVAAQKMERLQALARAVGKELGSDDPVYPDRPLTIVFLREARAHRRYLQGSTGLVARSLVSHAEPEKRRVVLHMGAKDSALFHEVTHLLLAAHRRAPGAHHGLPLWFEEGFAEWMSSGRPITKNGVEHWEFGLFLAPRALDLERRGSEDRLLSLKELLDATIATRDGWLETDSHKLSTAYAQGWALVHFLKHYEADADGRVVFGVDGRLGTGRYMDGWRRWLTFQVGGKNGRPYSGRAAFQEALRLDDEGLERAANAYRKWSLWLGRKAKLQHVANGRVIRGNRRGRSDDDLLPR